MTHIGATKTLSIKRSLHPKVRSFLLGGILALAAIIGPVQTIFAVDPSYEWSRSSLTGTAQRQWYDVASSSDGMKLVAVAAGGMIYTSTDGGDHWLPRESSGARRWIAVASSADGVKLVAVAAPGYLYTSTDSGDTWTEHTDLPSTYWNDVAISADGSKVAAVRYDNTIYMSDTGGATWTSSYEGEPDKEWAVVSMSADGSQLVAGDDGGYLWKSVDSGATWNVDSEATGNWNSVASSADGSKLIAVSYGDAFYTSIDGGDWVANELGIDDEVTEAAISANGQHMVVAGRNAPIFISANGGDTWQTRAQESSPMEWQGMAYSADGTRLVGVVYNKTGIRTSLNDATTWIEHTLTDIGEWGYVLPSDDGSVIVVQEGQSGIRRSVNGGATWNSYPFETGIQIDRFAMSANGMTLAGVDFTNNLVYTSADGGQTWVNSAITIAPDEYFGAIAISDDGARVVATTNNDVHISTDGGSTWTKYASVIPEGPDQLVASSDTQVLVARVYPGQFYLSTNGGQTWSEISIPEELADANFLDMDMSADGNTIIVGTIDGLYLVSSNGATWTKQNDVPSYAWNAVASSANGQTLIASALEQGIWVSTDAGLTWHQQEIVTTTNKWSDVASSADGASLFASEYPGYLYQTPVQGQEETPPEEETPPAEETPTPPAAQPPTSNTPSGTTKTTTPATTVTPADDTPAEDKPAINLMEESAFRAGDDYNVEVTTGQVLSFKANEAPHTFTIDNVQGNAVTFTLRSTPQTHTLQIGETGKYDVDGDKTDDISVTVNDVVRDTAQLTIVNLLATKVSVLSTPQDEATDTADTKAKPAFTISPWIWAAGAALVLIIVTTIIIRKAKRA